MDDTFFEGSMKAIFIEEACSRKGLSKVEKKKQIKVIKDCTFTKEQKEEFADVYIRPFIKEMRDGKLVDCKEGTVGCDRLIAIAESVIFKERGFQLSRRQYGKLGMAAVYSVKAIALERNG